MGTVLKNWNRNWEKQSLRKKINEMLEELKVSKKVFKKTMPKMNGVGYKHEISTMGGQASLRQKYTFLKGVYEFRKKQEAEEAEREKNNEK